MSLLRWLRGEGRDAESEGAGYQPLRDGEAGAPDGWNPEQNANPASRLMFSFADSLIKKGKAKHLDREDLWDMAKNDESSRVYVDFEENLGKTRTDECPNGKLGSALAKTYMKPFLSAGFLKLFHDSLMFLGPLLLRRLLRSLQDGSEGWKATLVLAVMMSFASMLQTFCVNQYFHILFRMSLHMKVSTIHLVYDKLLRLSNASKAAMGGGTINNLQSNDTSKIWQIPQYLHMLWSGPFQIIVVMAMLINVMTVWPALAGLAVTIALIPLNTVLGKAVGAVRKRLISATDARVRYATEVITGIKAIKLYAWEEPYKAKTLELRDAELKQIRASNLLGSFYMLIFIAGPILVSLASFSVYALMGNKLTSDVAFPALALFNLLRFPIMMFPIQIMNMINGAVALRRLQAFLGRGEIGSQPVLPAAAPGQNAVAVSSGMFAWSQEDGEEPTLKDIELKVLSGELYVVVGEVGSGKSSLLSSLLGEMVQRRGDVTIRGGIAYTSQDSWIQNLTLRDNILMGRPFDASYYEFTLDVCALRSDLEQLEAGDQTEIGEKGINLSGGQRARVALARAVYARADVYLLDDPLSAVDAHVGAHLFRECISGALQKTTRILVTHQLQFLPMADKIVVMRGGRIEATGTFDELVAKGVNFTELAVSAPETPSEDGASASTAASMPAPTASPAAVAPADRPSSSPPQNASLSAPSANDEVQEADGAGAEGEASETAPLVEDREREGSLQRSKKNRSSGRLVQEEQRAKGRVKGSIYLAYMKSWGPAFLIPISFTLLLHAERGIQIFQNYWLSVWSNATVAEDVDNTKYLAVYFFAGLISVGIALIRVLALVFGAYNASRSLHKRLLDTILSLPMSFFDTQPTGRLLNRFTKDTEAVDVQLSNSFSSFALCFVNVWLSLAVVISVTPVFAIMIIPIGIIYWRLQDLFIATSRELKRLDSVAFSPIFSHFSETLQGLVTVRAFRKQGQFSDKHQHLLDTSNRCWWPIQVSNRWLSVRLELIGNAIAFTTAICVAVLLPTNSGLAGLALTSALNLTGLMTWMVRQSTDLEVNMNSVERMIEYESEDPEAPAIIEDFRPPASWPSRGEIKVDSLVVKYRADLPPVLKSLTFDVKPAEKIGIAGRTGCGKSTLMMSIFRIVEPCGGSLTIDGINVLHIGLKDLRSKLALVPQDPVIFSGSVRSNLDPFGHHSDQQLWESLSKVSMSEVVRNMTGGLSANIEEGGANLSVGQRQLLGMARALIRNARILVLDEATSNVDTSTDLLIQKTIKGAFAQCSVLTIAHRLHTIMHSDRIMVLEAGEIAEYAPPDELLMNPDGMFSKLVEEATRQGQGGMKASASEAKLAQKIKEEADAVRRLSAERKRG